MRGKRSGPQPTTDTVLRRLEVAITRLECAAASLNAVVERLATAPPSQRLDITGLSDRFKVEFPVCSRCGALKPIEKFYQRPTQLDPEQRHRQCRDCLTAADRSRRVAPRHAEVPENLTGGRRLRRSRSAPSRSAPTGEPSVERRKI